MSAPENRVYKPSEVNFRIEDVEERQAPRKVLMCTPDFFKVVDVKNVYMEDNIGNIDTTLAQEQWQSLKSTYLKLRQRGILEEVYVIKGVEGLEDMVFAANQSFPWLLDDEKLVILSKMRHERRQREVPYFRDYYHTLGYRTIELNKTKNFEGRGDVILHFGKNLIYGGYGYRSNADAYIEIAELLKVPVVTLELIDPRFYHLDTCFIPVDQHTVFLVPDAFTEDGLAGLSKLFRNIIKIPVEEAEQFFALNAHCINDIATGAKVAIVQTGTTVMKHELELQGFEVLELDTSEFMKSGGSVFCMKMMLY